MRSLIRLVGITILLCNSTLSAQELGQATAFYLSKLNVDVSKLTHAIKVKNATGATLNAKHLERNDISCQHQLQIKKDPTTKDWEVSNTLYMKGPSEKSSWENRATVFFLKNTQPPKVNVKKSSGDEDLVSTDIAEYVSIYVQDSLSGFIDRVTILDNDGELSIQQLLRVKHSSANENSWCPATEVELFIDNNKQDIGEFLVK